MSKTIYRIIVDKGKMTVATSGAGTGYPSGAPEFTPKKGAQSIVFCICAI